MWGFGLACLLVAAVLSVSIQSTSTFIKNSKWMLHTVEVRDRIEKVSTLFVTAQNHIRAYHFTNQDYYRLLHEEARGALVKQLDEIRLLIQDNPVQVKNLKATELLINDRVERWKQSYEPGSRSSWETIRTRMMSDEVKSRDLELLGTIGALKAEEDRLLAERTNQVERQGGRSGWLVGFGGVLACVLIVLAAFLVHRDNQRREMAEAEIDRFFTLSLDLLCISGMDGYFKRLSPSYADVLGFSLEDLYKRPILDFVHPDDVARTIAEIERQSAGNKVLAFENRFLCRDGGYKTFSWKSVPVDGLMYAVARDVTMQKKFEAELVAAREAAQSAAQTKSAFLANMSHEIRTPLNGVVGMTDLIARTNLDPEQKELVGGIRHSTLALLKIVNEILDFSKIEAGRMQVEKTDFALAQLIEAQISMVGVQAAEKNLRLETVLDPALPKWVSGDSGKVGQILLNLLGNAVKFTRTGTVAVKVDVESATEQRCSLKIAIRDTGIGMSADQTRILFEPFVQADGSTARKYGGTGLGLSICKRLAEMMGGEIGVSSRSGEGSEFWVRLTFDLPSAAKSLALQSQSASSQTAVDENLLAARGDFQILIAEDNQVNQMVIMSMMKVLGYDATLAKNGEEAVRLCRETSFDLILMDQHMPVMDGIAATTEIRKQNAEGGKQIPVIAFTATVVQAENKQLHESLFDGFLLKPVTLEALEATLVDWQRRARV